jgi:hypothetical protein
MNTENAQVIDFIKPSRMSVKKMKKEHKPKHTTMQAYKRSKMKGFSYEA